MAKDDKTHENTTRTRRRCGLPCLLATLLAIVIIIVVIVILIFTVFKIKNPTMTINKIRLGSGQVGGFLPMPGSNISMVVATSVKNPNPSDFKFSNTTSSIFYEGIMVGQGFGPSGKARARKSVNMNIMVDLVATKLLGAPNLSTDLGSGLFTMDSYTVAPGKVKIILVNKKVTVQMNCSVTFNITDQEIKNQKCTSRVDF